MKGRTLARYLTLYIVMRETRKGYVRLPPARGSEWLKRLLNLTFAKSCPKVAA